LGSGYNEHGNFHTERDTSPLTNGSFLPGNNRRVNTKSISMKRQFIRCAEDLYLFTPAHPVETIANLDKIAIRENGEPLVDLRAASPGVLVQPLSSHKKTLHARTSVAQRLNTAQEFLQEHAPGHQIIVVDAWRSMSQQVFWHNLARVVFRVRHPLWSAGMVREIANKYVAAPNGIAPPPHSTGGAIDVRLRDATGKTVCMGPRKPAACRTAYDGLSAAQRKNRDLLCRALESAGFSNYEEEWWHWSYGDSGWALRTNQPHAFYGRVDLLAAMKAGGNKA
jgi:D-alanyl-D-alanine dipeptidase